MGYDFSWAGRYQKTLDRIEARVHDAAVILLVGMAIVFMWGCIQLDRLIRKLR